MVGGVTIWANILYGQEGYLTYQGSLHQCKQALSNQQKQPQYEYPAATTAMIDCSSIN